MHITIINILNIYYEQNSKFLAPSVKIRLEQGPQESIKMIPLLCKRDFNNDLRKTVLKCYIVPIVLHIWHGSIGS